MKNKGPSQGRWRQSTYKDGRLRVSDHMLLKVPHLVPPSCHSGDHGARELLACFPWLSGGSGLGLAYAFLNLVPYPSRKGIKQRIPKKAWRYQDTHGFALSHKIGPFCQVGGFSEFILTLTWVWYCTEGEQHMEFSPLHWPFPSQGTLLRS